MEEPRRFPSRERANWIQTVVLVGLCRCRSGFLWSNGTVARIVCKWRIRQAVQSLSHIVSLVTFWLPNSLISPDNPESLKIPYGVALPFAVMLYGAVQLVGVVP